MKTKAKKQVPLRFGSSLHQLVKTKLHENMTVSSGAMGALEDQAAFLIDRILHAAGEVQRDVLKSQTLSAAALKGGLSLVFPSEACARAVEAGERAVIRLAQS